MARQARLNPPMRWLDDRLHIAGTLDAALKHPVPKATHPLDYLGEATIFVFINQALTGMMLAMFYNGSANEPYTYDPTTGQFREITRSPIANSGSPSFTTPGPNGQGDFDWVLVLETGR